MKRNCHFVLVPGAWMGSWVWDGVAAPLAAEGHDVTAVTLSGLADRFDVPASEIGLATHVEDIFDVLQAEDEPGRVILVGHSYSGVPVGQAASNFDRLLKLVVYLDANVAHEGQSFIGPWTDEGRAQGRAEIAANDGVWPLQAAEFEGQDLSEAQVARLVECSTPHPGRTLTEPATLNRPLGEIPSVYVKCLVDGPEPSPDVLELLESPNWELREIDTGPWPMTSRPDQLVAHLLALC